MSHHDLKQFTEHFKRIVDGKMKAIARLNDREYEIGDTVTLHEGWPDAQAENGFHYTGKTVSAYISDISDYGCQPGFILLSLGRVGLTICL